MPANIDNAFSLLHIFIPTLSGEQARIGRTSVAPYHLHKLSAILGDSLWQEAIVYASHVTYCQFMSQLGRYLVTYNIWQADLIGAATDESTVYAGRFLVAGVAILDHDEIRPTLNT